LDQYDQVGIDDDDHDAMRFEDRLDAERMMNQRDKMMQNRKMRMPDAFQSDDGEFSENDQIRKQMRFAQRNEEMMDAND